jgi:hypothetical protein
MLRAYYEIDRSEEKQQFIKIFYVSETKQAQSQPKRGGKVNQ